MTFTDSRTRCEHTFENMSNREGHDDGDRSISTLVNQVLDILLREVDVEVYISIMIVLVLHDSPCRRGKNERDDSLSRDER